MLNISNHQGNVNQNHHENLTPVRRAVDKKKINKNIKTHITSVGEDVEKREPLCAVGGNINWYSYYEK